MVLVDKGAVGGKDKGLLGCLDCRSSQVTLLFGAIPPEVALDRP